MKKTLYLLLTKLVLFTVNAYGNVLYTFDLSRSNTIQIQDGKICVQAAECLDETCGVYCNHCQPCGADEHLQGTGRRNHFERTDMGLRLGQGRTRSFAGTALSLM